MAEFIIKMPDIGEGVAEAELVEWHVKIGDLVREDTILAAVMTDKATVEIPSPVEGTISWLGAEIGDTVAVGSPIVKIDVSGEVAVEAGGADTPTPNPSPHGGGELSVEPVAAEAPSAPAPSKAETATAKTESPSPLWGGARGGGMQSFRGQPAHDHHQLRLK